MNMITKVNAADEVSAGGRLSGLTKGQKISLAAIPLALIAALAAWETQGTPAPAAPPPPIVTVASPLVRQVAEWDDYSGRFEASKSIEVRPRVSGAIVGVHFTDGAFVRQGQLLFTIDPRPYLAALAQARAAIASARSDLALAQADFGRANRLLGQHFVAVSDVDRLRAKVEAAEAELAAANAQAQARALDLSFTQVRAPISGRISDRRIDPGNLVQGGGGGADGSLLTTINAVDPIYFTFDASEGLFLKARRARETGAAPSDVQIRLQDETDYRWRGRLDFADNSLDTHSGTIRLRAIVSNGTQFLTPGMFGNMRLSTGVPETALLVPDSAVSTDQARKIVMVAGKDGSLTPHPVTVGPVIDGLRVIRSGLAPTDKVVIAGAQLVLPGMKAKLQPGRITTVAVAAAAPPDTVSAPLSGEATFASR